jgi:phosphoribosyl-ATP pyrophosphohydrolase/phosphoribosyl-AMP cyclohydrolase
MLDSIDWLKVDNLIPVIVQEQSSSIVLMLAYMNRESLELTIQTKLAHYYSRTKKRIWKKGESSGHIQQIKSMKLDCDNDTILIKVKQIGGTACHTGEKSCFFTTIIEEKQNEISTSIINQLFDIINSKKNSEPTISYTAKLFSRGENEILKKVIEEAGEFCFAIKDNNKNEIIYEMSDLIYHSLVALSFREIKLNEILQEVAKRFDMSGIEEKKNRKNK